MERRELGSTGQAVSRLCLGTWQMSGEWGPRYDEAIAAVGRAFELGINFFDTAHAYGEGAAEAALAKGLGDLLGSHREEVVISTKGGIEFRRGPGGEVAEIPNSDAAYLRRTLEQSLGHLGVDHVDVYFIHWPDPTIPFERVAATVRGFVDEGLVRFVGVSNFSVAQMEAFAAGARIDVAQLPYNLLDRRSEEELFPYCVEHGIGVMGWSGLAHGLLSGIVRRDHVFAADDWRASHPAFQGDDYAAVMEAVEELIEIADARGCSLPQLALAWILASDVGVVPIVGAQVPEHIVDSAAAVELDLSADELRRIAAIVEGLPTFGIGLTE